MVKVRLRLFGSLDVTRADGTKVVLPTRKSAALLGLLAREPGSAHSRSRLAGMLWSESPDQQARANLRQTLCQLRRSLPELAIRGGETLSLAGDEVETDLALFEVLARADTTDALDKAGYLARGPFLDGIGLDEPVFRQWLEIERAQLRLEVVGVLRRLLSLWLQAEEGRKAEATALRLLAIDPLDEEVHRTLIRLHAARGSIGKAFAQYRACCDILRREFGIAPSAETEALGRALGRQGCGVSAPSLADGYRGRRVRRP